MEMIDMVMLIFILAAARSLHTYTSRLGSGFIQKPIHDINSGLGTDTH